MSRMVRPFTVLVEGNIGAGKSHFLSRFNSLPGVDILQEPVDRWRNLAGHNLLELMYQDPANHWLAFQRYADLTRLEQHSYVGQRVKLMERSLFSARYCFVENLRHQDRIHDSEYQVLVAWFNFLVKNPELGLGADLIVYLQTSPEVAYARLKARKRGEEHLIHLDYLKALHELHEDWLLRERFPRPAPVLVLDANKDYKDMESDFQNVKGIIAKHLQEKEAEERGGGLDRSWTVLNGRS